MLLATTIVAIHIAVWRFKPLLAVFVVSVTVAVVITWAAVKVRRPWLRWVVYPLVLVAWVGVYGLSFGPILYLRGYGVFAGWSERAMLVAYRPMFRILHHSETSETTGLNQYFVDCAMAGFDAGMARAVSTESRPESGSGRPRGNSP